MMEPKLSVLTEKPVDLPYMEIPLVHEVRTYGRPINSRYGPCVESLGGRFEMSCGALVERPGINYTLGWMELLQLVAGVYDLEAIKRVAPKANHSLFTYEMAYGPRAWGQIPELLRVLAWDPDSRQAVLFIGNRYDGPTSSLPCTLTMQFLLRNGKLHNIVNMRSWDLCRGLPYDIMMFSGLQTIMAHCLQQRPGQLIVHAGSAHIYDDQRDKIPYWSQKRWRFQHESSDWVDWVEWAMREVETLEKGGTPSGIVVY